MFEWKGFRVVMAHLQWKISEEEEDGEIGAGSTDLRRMLQKYTEGRRQRTRRTCSGVSMQASMWAMMLT